MASDIRAYPCNRCSFFSLSEAMVRDEVSGRPFHRICEIARKSGAKSVIVHRDVQKEEYFQSQYPHLLREIQEKINVGRLVSVTQVTFISRRIHTSTSPSSIGRIIASDDILATCVVVAFRQFANKTLAVDARTFSYVYEAVIRTPRSRPRQSISSFPENYTHVSSVISVKVLGHDFQIPGSYFVQENGIDGVCAQSCIKMSLIHIDGKPMRLPPTSGQINSAVSRYRSFKQQYPEVELPFDPLGGLTADELRHVIQCEGGEILILDTERNPEIPPYEFAYLLIESGISTLVAFCADPPTPPPETTDSPPTLHVMPVVGHTLNADKWLPIRQISDPQFDLDIDRQQHRYRSTAEWACHLVIHDDVLGPFYCLSQHDLLYPPDVQGKRLTRVRYVIGLVPKDAGFTVSPYTIQQIACNLFEQYWELFLPSAPRPWKRRLANGLLTPNTLVLRTQRATRRQYLNHLMGKKDHLGNRANLNESQRRRLTKLLPEDFWVCEFGVAGIYSVNQNALGEILVQFAPPSNCLLQAERKDVDLLVGFRFINQIWIPGHRKIRLGFESHYPLLRRSGISVAYQ